MEEPAGRTWLVTGASRGLGRSFAEAVLDSGDRLVATARDATVLAPLTEGHPDVLAFDLDVTDRAQVDWVVARTIEQFGRLDVVVNNAGYGLRGGVEEVSEAQARAQMETNFFGALWVTQAVLPQMRAQHRGHIVQVSSIAGVVAPARFGLYAASKWALEAMSESLAREVAPFGIHVTLIEPSAFRTDWAGSSLVHAEPLAAYTEVLGPIRGPDSPKEEAGDPVRAATALLRIVDETAPPLRLLLGNQAFDVAGATYRQRLEGWAAWEELARSADFPASTDV